MELEARGESEAIIDRLHRHVGEGTIRVTLHGHEEMVADNVSYEALRCVLLDARLVENYPDHQRGPCCLVCGRDNAGRHLHVVCTTSLEMQVIITVYAPLPPKWTSPFERGVKDEM